MVHSFKNTVMKWATCSQMHNVGVCYSMLYTSIITFNHYSKKVFMLNTVCIYFLKLLINYLDIFSFTSYTFPILLK